MHLYLFREDTTFVEVSERVFIGRAMSCELLLPSDDRVARRHARVWGEGEGDAFFIEDLGSTQGVFLANDPIVKLEALHRIVNGDAFLVGKSWVSAMLRPDALETPLTRAAADEAASHPSDPGRREVWIDLLLERADPLGDWLSSNHVVANRWPQGATLSWSDRLIRKAEVTRAMAGIEILRSRLICHLLELTVDLENPEDAPGLLGQLLETPLPALRVIRLRGGLTLPRGLPLAPRVTIES